MYEHPRDLLLRLKIGREEFCQRLLTMLILQGPYPRWNSRQRPSERGILFLQSLHERCFGSSWSTDPEFVDELELPPRNEAEKGGAPDQALIWADRLWMIELKTEKASHRPTQIPLYFELGAYYFPGRSIDLTYLTPPMSADYSPPLGHQRYAHVSWPEVAPLIGEVWLGCVPEKPLVEALVDAIKQMTSETPSAHRERMLAAVPAETAPDVLKLAFQLAGKTAADGRQRALEFMPGDLEELLTLRKELRDRICAEPDDSALRHVRPWLWVWESTGIPLTEAGREVGYELRLSRYREKAC